MPVAFAISIQIFGSLLPSVQGVRHAPEHHQGKTFGHMHSCTCICIIDT
ncbi:hypothetical protein A359_05960 [secondary endosymbiont of Ctenarytaina eucalypti]|uniref:Uncharacterized protein n=1 Tax=secondary endosymbiont of Ctenarytaina eucalypti TaxID=1199245 RepID=J3TFH9_9ENTR|nr:hypothetical protein A359_05960 [secondary endosymbiont of Ctenarytaina eucalypti]